MEDLRLGSVVHLRASIVNTGAGRTDDLIGVSIEEDLGRMRTVWVNKHAITHVEPGPLKAGDTVRYHNVDWNVLAVDDEEVWLRRIDGDHVYVSVHKDYVQRYS